MTLILAFLSLQAFAAATLHTTGTVNVHDLSCITRAGDGDPAQRTYTQLGDRTSGLLLGREVEIELNHVLATGVGCEITKVDKIHLEALRFFGFKYDVPLTVTKSTTPFRDTKGACKVYFEETVQMDLGDGVVVESTQGEDRPSFTCP